MEKGHKWTTARGPYVSSENSAPNRPLIRISFVRIDWNAFDALGVSLFFDVDNLLSTSCKINESEKDSGRGMM
jgi:hypothetical protein